MEETVEFEKLEILYTSVILFLIESISVLGRYLKCWSHGKYFFFKNKAAHHQIIELLLLDTFNLLKLLFWCSSSFPYIELSSRMRKKTFKKVRKVK